MGKQISIKRNFIMNAVLNASAFIFPLITFPYVSRILTPVGTGKVAFATSVINYFSMVSCLGINTYGVRACAKVRDDREKLSRTAQEIFGIHLFMTVVVYIAFIASLFLVPKFEQEKILLTITSSMIVFYLIGMEWLYKALEQYSYITVRSLIFKALALVLVFLLIHNPEDYLFYGFTCIFASAGSNIMNFINVRKHITLKPLGNFNFKKHIKPILIFFGMSVSTTIYTNLDTVMLGFMKGDAEVGYYNAAVKVKTIVVSLVTSIGTVLLPRVSYYIEKKMFKEFKAVTAKAFNLVILMALPLVLYFIFYAKETIIFLSGDAYLPAIPPMMVIMPTVFLIGMSNILGIQILIPQGKEITVLVSEMVGAIVDMILNIILIPELGATGAAIGTLAAEVAVLLVQMIALRTFVFEIIKNVKMLKIVIACAAAVGITYGAALLPISSNFLMLILTALVFFGVYGIILLILKEPLMSETIYQMKEKVTGKMKS